MHGECKKVPKEKKAQQTAQPQERDRGGTAGWTRGRVSMHGEGQKMSDLAAPQKPVAQTCEDFMLRHPLGSLTPRRSWALGTHCGLWGHTTGVCQQRGDTSTSQHFPNWPCPAENDGGLLKARGHTKAAPHPVPLLSWDSTPGDSTLLTWCHTPVR